MFLTPVHPKKKFVDKVLAAVALEFTPIEKRKGTRVMREQVRRQNVEISRLRDDEGMTMRNVGGGYYPPVRNKRQKRPRGWLHGRIMTILS